MNTVTGFLTSQVGYDLGWPMRALVRGPEGFLSESGTAFTLQEEDTGQVVLTGPVTLWGDQWGSRWWVIDFSALDRPGRYRLSVEGREDLHSDPIEIGNGLLWERTWRWTGPDQAERRQRLARDHSGWYDAGAEWQEANSHAAYIAGFCDLLEFAADRLTPEEHARIEAQILNGCDYLGTLQDMAAAQDGGTGAVVHQVWKYETLILPADVLKAAHAWARAALRLSETNREKATEYLGRAERAMAWIGTAQPLGEHGFARIAHGFPADAAVPSEWMTRDLFERCEAALALAKAGREGFREEAVALAERLLARQVTASQPEGPFYGHFRLFDSTDVTEKAWVHNAACGMGADLGGQHPHGVLAFLHLLTAFPDHPDAARWVAALRDYAYGYFLPACRANPFGLLPLGWYAGHGLVWFSGLWHGMNAAYAWAAVMALEFERHFGDAAFREIAAGNLQWIAGLNIGVTAEGMFAAHMFSMDVPPGRALPVSMIGGIGHRRAGNWMNIRGAICNGFAAGDQFTFDVTPSPEADTQPTFTDEDWITHAGAWLSAISRLVR